MISSSPAQPLRVMRIITRMNVGGPATHVTLLNEGLTHLGYECLLVTGMETSREGTLKDEFASRQLAMEIIPDLGREINFRQDISTLIKLYQLMREWKPDIVHTHTAKAGLVGRLAAQLAGVSVVVHTFHGHVFHGYFGAAKTRVFIELEKFCAKLSSRIITISDRLKSEIVSYGITEASHIEVIPLGLELHRLKNVSTTNLFRAEFGLPADVGLVGAVGRLVPIKNLHLFLDAAAIAHRKNPNLRFAIVGDGELRRELETYAEQLQIEKAVIFTGWRRDLAQVYADLDAVVISSDNEGTPASLIEAMAAGCPVISTRVGGVADLIQEGYTGRLVPPRDPDALAQAILTLFQESRTTAQLAQQAQTLTLQNYTSERLVAYMDKFYKTLTFVSKTHPFSLGTVSAEKRS